MLSLIYLDLSDNKRLDLPQTLRQLTDGNKNQLSTLVQVAFANSRSKTTDDRKAAVTALARCNPRLFSVDGVCPVLLSCHHVLVLTGALGRWWCKLRSALLRTPST